MKELIEELYQGKLKFDTNCLENSQPRETFETFIPIYFNHKYGLKTLSIEWMNQLNKALVKYDKDMELEVFRKVKSNDINEEFVAVMKKCKDRLNDYIKNYARSKFPYMQEHAVKKFVDETVNSNLDEDMWNYVLASFQGKEKVIKEQLNKTFSPGKFFKKAKFIDYKDCWAIILAECLKDHELKIERVLKVFRKYDTQAKGFINHSDFKEAHLLLDISKDPDKSLQILDPFGSGKVIFSDITMFYLSEKGTRDESFLSIKNKSF